MATFTKRVAVAGDDGSAAYGTFGNGPVFGTGYGDLAARGFMRFTAVTIPPGSTVTAAKLTVSPTFADTGNLAARLACQAADNPTSPTTATNLTGRALTVARSAVWASTPEAWNGAVGVVDSPDLAAAVQEVISRTGWASGNALIVIGIDAGSTGNGYYEAESYESAPASAALLTVVYTAPVASDTTPPTVSLADPTPAGQTVGYEHLAGTVTLTATATDAGAGMARVEFMVDGAIVGTDSNVADSTFTVGWDTTTATDGPHTVTARAVDAASPANSTTSAGRPVVVNNSGRWSAASAGPRPLTRAAVT